MIALKLTFSLMALWLTLAACAQQNTTTTAADNVEMTVRVEPEPLAVGESTLIVILRDPDGAPVDGAKLFIHGDMDHEGMTPVDRDYSQSESGEYRVPFQWTMGGGWIVTITAQLPDSGGEINESFDFFVEAVSSESVINRNNHTDSENTAAVSIAYQAENDPAIGGDATVTIALTDADGRPVTGATVEVTGDMAHDGMMPISGEGEDQGDGSYLVPLRWTMAGDWQVTVHVLLADGRRLEQHFEQEVIVLPD